MVDDYDLHGTSPWFQLQAKLLPKSREQRRQVLSVRGYAGNRVGCRFQRPLKRVVKPPPKPSRMSTRTRAITSRSESEGGMALPDSLRYGGFDVGSHLAFMTQTGYPHGRPGYVIDHI